MAKAKVNVVRIYRDAAGEWRWSAIARNGKVVADSAEGYRNRSYCLKMARELFPTTLIEWASK